MRLAVALLVLPLLASCHSMESASPGHAAGRYTGIGVFDAGRLWAQMTGAPASSGATARIADDEHVIVVLDSHTGEVRQCGDHSGYCVVTNPWTEKAGGLPVALAKHASDLIAEDRSRTADDQPK